MEAAALKDDRFNGERINLEQSYKFAGDTWVEYDDIRQRLVVIHWVEHQQLRAISKKATDPTCALPLRP
jgi:hypothetical protein